MRISALFRAAQHPASCCCSSKYGAFNVASYSPVVESNAPYGTMTFEANVLVLREDFHHGASAVRR